MNSTFIPEIGSFDHHGSPFVVLDTGDLLKKIFDVAMAPILAFNGRYRCDVFTVSSRSARFLALGNLLPAPKA